MAREVCEPGPMTTDQVTDSLRGTPRATPRRKRERGSHERALVNAVLDEAIVCHVGFVADHGPVVLPMTYARIDDDLYLHGAAGNDMLRHLTAECRRVRDRDAARRARVRAVRVPPLDELPLRRAVRAGHACDRSRRDADHDPRPPRPPRARTQRRRAATDRGRAPRARSSSGCPSTKARPRFAPAGRSTTPKTSSLPVWAGEVPLRLVAQSPIPDTGAGDAPAVPDYIIDRVARP